MTQHRKKNIAIPFKIYKQNMRNIHYDVASAVSRLYLH